jgi:hypothetical protein
MDLMAMLPGLFGSSMGGVNFGTGNPMGGSPFQGMMKGMTGGLPGTNFQGNFGQGNPFNQAMPNLMEHSSVPMPLGLGVDNSMAQPGAFPSMGGMPDVTKIPGMETERMLQAAQMAGMPFNREQRPNLPPGGIHRMNQMAPYQFGAARMVRR